MTKHSKTCRALVEWRVMLGLGQGVRMARVSSCCCCCCCCRVCVYHGVELEGVVGQAAHVDVLHTRHTPYKSRASGAVGYHAIGITRLSTYTSTRHHTIHRPAAATGRKRQLLARRQTRCPSHADIGKRACEKKPRSRAGQACSMSLEHRRRITGVLRDLQDHGRARDDRRQRVLSQRDVGRAEAVVAHVGRKRREAAGKH